jgi:MFS family permease
MLIFATAVIPLQAIYDRSYADLIWLGTASFVAFGVFSLPAGWLADRWSRRNMLAAYYLGCGISLAAAALAPGPVALAAALFALGMFAAIYHPVGMAMLIDASKTRGRTLAFNGVCGNVGAALAAGITGAFVSWLGWRAAFAIPAVICVATGLAYLALVPDDRHRAGTRQTVADVVLAPRVAAIIFGVYVIISICGGLVFNTVSIALPKIVDERLGESAPLIAVGGLTTAVFLCGAAAQLAMGRLVERVAPHLLFAAVVATQLLGLLWAGAASGPALMIALAVTMAGIYAQVTTGDVVVARYTADAWRGRIYAVRYFLTFVSAGASGAIIASLHARGGFDLVFAAIAATAAILLAAVLVFVIVVSGLERERQRAVQPAE